MGTEVRSGDAGDVAIVEITDDDYQSVYGAPFVTLMMNKADGQYEGEVVISGTAEVDDARFQELLDVGLIYGQKVLSMEHSNAWGTQTVLVNFAPYSGVSS